jgi:hypothetical protein
MSTATPTIQHRPSSIGFPGAPWLIAALVAVAMAVAAAFVIVQLDDSSTEPVPRTVDRTVATDTVSDHLNDLPSRFSDERVPGPSVAESDPLYSRFSGTGAATMRDLAIAEQWADAMRALEAQSLNSVSDHLNDLPSRFSEERAPAAPVVESDSLYTRFGEDKDH